MLEKRLHIIVLLLILLFDLPLPHVVLEKTGKIITGETRTQKIISVTYDPEFSVEIKEPCDSTIFSLQDKRQSLKTSKLGLRLNQGVNQFQLIRFAGHTVDTLQYIIYRGSKKTKISVVSGYITPIFKILRFVGYNDPNLEMRYFLFTEGNWLELTRTGLKKVTKPDFDSYNLNILLDKAMLPQLKSNKTPILLISEKEPNAKNFREVFVTGNLLRLHLKNIKISSQQKDYTDTLLTLEPYFLPIAGRISGMTFELLITDLYETYMRNPENITEILSTVIKHCKIPKIQPIVLADNYFIIAEPPEFPSYLKIEIQSDTEKMFPKILFDGYQQLPVNERPQRYTVKTIVDGETVDSFEIETSPLKRIKPGEQYREKRKIALVSLPAQGNPTFLILFFIVTALTFTLSKSGRPR